MKKGKIIIAITLFCFFIILVVFGVSIESDETGENQVFDDINSEIEPEEEVPEESNYDVKLSLYFEDRISGILVKEERVVNAKNLLDNPYIITINELLKGPYNTNLVNPIPEGTKVNNAKFENGTLIVDMSKEFLNANGTNAIYSIVNTVSEYNEIENVKITIDGEEKNEFKEKFVKRR